MFYEFPFALRFELGDAINYSEEPIRRVLRALDRSREVARRLFADSETVSAVISQYGGRLPTADDRRTAKELRVIGFRKPLGLAEPIPEHDEDHIAEHGEDLYRRWHCIELTSPRDEIDTLLWASVTAEGIVRPKVRWPDIYLVDFQLRRALCVYDDRGMDVVAAEPEALAPLYRDCNSWLLDYDRDRMDATFQPLIATLSG